MVHRDVKAENVLFDEVERPMLADFGIALRRGSNPRLTNAGLAVGSTAYMPPEQARGAEVDRRVDLYSIGVLTWEMLTGRLPYNAADALSMALKHVQDPIPRLPATLKHWQGFIDRAMAKRPEDRYASAQDMLLALDQLEARAGKGFVAVEVPATIEPGPAAKQPGNWKPWALAAAAVAVLGIAAFRFFPVEDDVIRATPAGVSASSAANELPSPDADARTGLMTGMSEGGTEGLAAYLANAGQQMRDGHLLSPPNANAWDSLDAAWRVNATHPQTQQLTAQLFDALAEASDRALRTGDVALSRTAFERASQLDSRRGGEGSAIALLAQAPGCGAGYAPAGVAGQARCARRAPVAGGHPLAGPGSAAQPRVAGAGRCCRQGRAPRHHHHHGGCGRACRAARPGGDDRGHSRRLCALRQRHRARRGRLRQGRVRPQAQLEHHRQ